MNIIPPTCPNPPTNTPEVKESTIKEQLQNTRDLLESDIAKIDTLINWIDTYPGATKILKILKFSPHVNISHPR